MAPRVGFEPTTYRLTAGCSTVELSRKININYIRIPAMTCSSKANCLSTIGPAGLNFRVRYGNGCFPCGIITRIYLTH